MKRWLALALIFLSACATPPSVDLPEAASGRQAKTGWQFKQEAVVAAHPLAAQAGAQVLRDGGNAVDAAVATALVLAVVEPQSSGIGGGGFLLLWDGAQLRSFDGRETAPAAVREGLFLLADGKTMPRAQATASGLSVGIPGQLRLLANVQGRHGRLTWARLVQPALRFAQEGFPIGPRLHRLLRVDTLLRQDPAAARFYYQPDGQPWPVGQLLRNPALAAILQRVADEGSASFYLGPVAQDLVQRVSTHARPGRMTLEELGAYQVRERDALCAEWMRWRLCGASPPAAGALMVAQLLALSGTADLDTEAGLLAYAKAARIASEDRDLHLADPDYVEAPGKDWRTLLDRGYLARRTAGEASLPSPFAPQRDPRESGTTHLSVVDAHGMAVSFTTSVESAFGSRILADGGTGLPGGYLLNNQLTDFAFQPRAADGRPVANRAEPGKRPRSSMAPMMVFEQGQLQMVLGSPGGLAIPHFNAKLLLRHLGRGEPHQAAVDAPNVLGVAQALVIERGAAPALLSALRAQGLRVIEADLTSGQHTLRRSPQGWTAAADPRREGFAAGR